MLTLLFKIMFLAAGIFAGQVLYSSAKTGLRRYRVLRQAVDQAELEPQIRVQIPTPMAPQDLVIEQAPSNQASSNQDRFERLTRFSDAPVLLAA